MIRHNIAAALRGLGPTIRTACVGAASFLSPATADAQGILPEPIEEVLTVAEARIEPGQRWAFTRTYIENGNAAVERYDPRRPAGSEWFRPAPEAAAGEDAVDRVVVRAEGERNRPCDMPPSDLVLFPDADDFANLRSLIGSGIQPIEGDATKRRYAFWPTLESYPGVWNCEPQNVAALYRQMEGEVILATDEPGFVVSVHAPEPFRFERYRYRTFEMTRRYGEVVPGGPITLLSFEQSFEIDAPFPFSDISGERTASYSDFDRVGTLP